MNKISRHALAFNSGWFEQHQQKLLWLVNHPLLSYWFRWVLRINGNRSAVGRQKITRINPEAIFWLLPNGTHKAELRTHPKFGKRLYHAFKPLWWSLHFLDWLFIDRWIPEYSFGFDSLTAYPQAGSGGGNTTVDGVVYTFLQSTWDLARTASPATPLILPELQAPCMWAASADLTVVPDISLRSTRRQSGLAERSQPQR